jgi:hypothetical protein
MFSILFYTEICLNSFLGIEYLTDCFLTPYIIDERRSAQYTTLFSSVSVVANLLADY